MWKKIKIPNYMVSDSGEVKSIDRWIDMPNGFKQFYPSVILRLCRTNKKIAYLRVDLSCCGKKKMFLVHRLVAEAFLPNPENKPHINHKNGIKTDNRVSNLEWATRLENVEHAVKNGLCPKGEKIRSSKLTDEQVRVIKKLLFSKTKRKRGYYAGLARHYGVSKCTISDIKKQRTWDHIEN